MHLRTPCMHMEHAVSTRPHLQAVSLRVALYAVSADVRPARRRALHRLPQCPAALQHTQNERRVHWLLHWGRITAAAAAIQPRWTNAPPPRPQTCDPTSGKRRRMWRARSRPMRISAGESAQLRQSSAQQARTTALSACAAVALQLARGSLPRPGYNSAHGATRPCGSGGGCSCRGGSPSMRGAGGGLRQACLLRLLHGRRCIAGLLPCCGALAPEVLPLAGLLKDDDGPLGTHRGCGRLACVRVFACVCGGMCECALTCKGMVFKVAIRAGMYMYMDGARMQA